MPMIAADAATLASRMVSGRTGSGESTITSRRSGKVLSQLTTVKSPTTSIMVEDEGLFFARSKQAIAAGAGLAEA